MTDDVIQQLRSRMQREGLALADVSAATGVGVQSLARHVAGEYVRSDSLAKYRLWLNGEGPSRRIPRKERSAETTPLFAEPAPPQVMDFLPPMLVPAKPRRVVDLFCGCGGMSLGFERFKKGQVFQTALALDIEEPMVRVFNDNHSSRSTKLSVGRQVDITDFLNESEVLAFYLDHLARAWEDEQLASELSGLGEFSLSGFRAQLQRLDEEFLQKLNAVRCSEAFRLAVAQVGPSTLGQTSIVGFHAATKLPLTGTGSAKFGPLIWHGDGEVARAQSSDCPVRPSEELTKRCRSLAERLWKSEVQKLSTRAQGNGRGQLAKAAERIGRYLAFLKATPMVRIRQIWLDWRASRDAIRLTFLENQTVHRRLRELYESDRQVSVILGGPPCQGFSRIGRGKIRSLREQSVHVQEDENSVDSRNQLMHQYVLFVAAFEPEVFLFENVRHFQAVVKSEGVEFDAADILAEAIREVSTRSLGYAIAKKIVVASKHAVPQARERFVMAGVRRDRDGALSGVDAASWCLSLQAREAVPLAVALEELPEPVLADAGDCRTSLPVREWQSAGAKIAASVTEIYRSWTRCSETVDAHLARPHRNDDAAFFALMGPGKRWMDYRCDSAPTLARLSSVLASLQAALAADSKLEARLGVRLEDVRSLCASADGSLSLKLLLENIEPQPGELQHHLLTETYLRKKEGAHGDWLSRMDASQPSKTIVSHMSKDTYAFVHPFRPRTLSVREAARIQSFPDDYKFGSVGLVDGFKVVGNAVPPLLSVQFAERVAQILALVDASRGAAVVVREPRPAGAYR